MGVTWFFTVQPLCNNHPFIVEIRKKMRNIVPSLASPETCCENNRLELVWNAAVHDGAIPWVAKRWNDHLGKIIGNGRPIPFPLGQKKLVFQRWMRLWVRHMTHTHMFFPMHRLSIGSFLWNNHILRHPWTKLVCFPGSKSSWVQ